MVNAQKMLMEKACYSFQYFRILSLTCLVGDLLLSHLVSRCSVQGSRKVEVGQMWGTE